MKEHCGAVVTEQDVAERGWLHAHTDTGEFGPRQLARLAGAPIGTVVWLSAEQYGQICPPAPNPDPNSAVAGFDAVEFESIFEQGTGDEGVLLHVERVYHEGGGGEYRIIGRHHPRDAYAAPGTPLREALDLIQGAAVDVCELSYAGYQFRSALGINAVGANTAGKFAAAALEAAGRNTCFPGSCQHGDEYLAVAARDLIGRRDSGWTWMAYELIARPYAHVVGRKLHPDDPDSWLQSIDDEVVADFRNRWSAGSTGRLVN